MKTIPGTALVEMGDEYAVERAVTHLNSVKLFGKKLNVWYVCMQFFTNTDTTTTIMQKLFNIVNLCVK